jgi:hypothetical protein
MKSVEVIRISKDGVICLFRVFSAASLAHHRCIIIIYTENGVCYSTESARVQVLSMYTVPRTIRTVLTGPGRPAGSGEVRTKYVYRSERSRKRGHKLGSIHVPLQVQTYLYYRHYLFYLYLFVTNRPIRVLLWKQIQILHNCAQKYHTSTCFLRCY